MPSLRGLRKRLKEGDRAGRYLRYAIGEIVLVVIGILLALQIDEWNEARNRNERERQYLGSMVEDLQEDLAQIDDATAGNRIIIAGLDSLLVLLANPRPSDAYRRNLFVHSMVYTYWYLLADFPELTMNQLRYSGDLQLIRDPDVRLGMLRYEQGLARVRYTYSQLEHYFHVVEASQKRIFNYLLAAQGLALLDADYRNMLGPLSVFEPVVPDGRYLLNDALDLLSVYYVDVRFYRATMNNTVHALDAQRGLADSVAALIGTRYPDQP